MYAILALIIMSVLGLIAFGFYLELRPKAGLPSEAWLKPLLGGNLILVAVGTIAILLLGAQEVMASEELVAETSRDMVGLGLALLGVGLPTGLAAIAAGMAVGPLGAAALGVIAEKPELFGRTLIYMGLAEGIAIDGLVVTILLLDKI